MKKQTTKKRTAKKPAAKRELIAPRGDKRYIRRDAKGRIKESDDVSRSLSQDRRRKAKTTAKAGRATGAIANPRKPPHGKKRVPAGNATLDLFGQNSLPEGMKYQAAPRKNEPSS